MASVFKRGKTWSYRASFVDEHGNRQQPTKGGFRTRALATAAAAELENTKLSGGNISRADISLVDYWEQWVDLYKRGKHAMVTEKRYDIIGKSLKKYFGSRMLSSIRPSEWQEFLNDYGKSHARESSSKLNSYVRSMVKMAINDQVLHVDFTLGAVTTGQASKSETEKFLQSDELKAVMQAAYDRADYAHITSCIVYLGAVSGARYSELIALTWKDIDFDDGTININKTWDYHFNQGFLPTKTPSGVRIVDVHKSAIAMLERLRTQQTAFYMKTGQRDNYGMVFRTKMGTIPTNAAANKALGVIEDKAEEKLKRPLSARITFHGLRHSHVSYLLSQHIDIYYISKRIGHSDITITQKVYSHMLDTLSKEQVSMTINALDKISAQ